MNLRRLKLLEIAFYVAASVAAFLFRLKTGYQRFDGSYPVRDSLDTFIFPYGILIILTLLLLLSKSTHLPVLCLVASVFVFVGTLLSYIYLPYIKECRPCWVFFGAPIYLFVCWFLVLIVGVALVRLYSYRRKIGV